MVEKGHPLPSSCLLLSIRCGYEGEVGALSEGLFYDTGTPL